MREAYHRELDLLDQDVLRLGSMVLRAIDGATDALVHGDTDRACRVAEGDSAVDDLVVQMEKRALVLLAGQQPVAGELRLIVSILRVLTDLERSGDLASNIATLVCRDLKIVIMREASLKLYELAGASARLFGRSLDVWGSKDAEAAAGFDLLDDEIDTLYEDLLRALFEMRADASFEVAMKLVLVARYYERIADHAVNIAKRVRFLTTGEEAFLG